MFKVGDKVQDRDGIKGVIADITHWDGSHWYDVRFDRGTAVRFDRDLSIQEEA
jgi:hypothetical protein